MRGRALLRPLSAIAAVAALLWLFDRIGWQRTHDTLTRIGLPGFVLLVAFGMVESLLDALGLRASVADQIPRRAILGYQSAGALINMIVPLEAGEVLKGSLMSRHVPAPEAAAGTFIWNYIYRITRPLAALLGWGLGAALNAVGPHLPVRAPLILLAATALTFAPYFGLRLLLRVGISQRLVALGRRLRLIRNDRADETWRRRAEFIDNVVHLYWTRQRSSFFAILRLQMAARVLGIAACVVAVRALAPGDALSTAVLLYVGLNTGEYLLLFLPARLGIAEGVGYLVAGLLGLEPSLGLFTALLLRLRSITANGLAVGSIVIFPPVPRSPQSPPSP